MSRLSNVIDQFNCLSGINRFRAVHQAMVKKDNDAFLAIAETAFKSGRIQGVLTADLVETVTARLAQDVAAMLSKSTVSEVAAKSLNQFIDLCRMIRGQEHLQLGIPGRAMASVVQAVLQRNRVGDLVRLRMSVEGNGILDTFMDFAIREDGETLMGENAMKAYRDRLAAARAVVPLRQQAAQLQR